MDVTLTLSPAVATRIQAALGEDSTIADYKAFLITETKRLVRLSEERTALRAAVVAARAASNIDIS